VSFIFYDTETTGIDTAFDQIVQFAAIRTDDDLNELGRFEIRSRLLPWIVPSPYALKVTGLTIDDLLSPAHPTHYEMVRQIRETLRGWGPSVFSGYNTIKFDEELLRQAFFQTLHPPYLTNTGGSARADVLALVQTAALLYPNAIAVPLSDKGRPVFKLDRIAPANGFDHANAHDALADVEATIFMAKLAKDRCPYVWRRWLHFSSKERVRDFVTETPAFVVVQPMRQAAHVVTMLGTNPDQPNLAYCWDLTVDPRSFAAMEGEELAAALRKAGAPVRKIKANAAPSLCPLEEVPDHLLGDISPEVFGKRGRWMSHDREFARRVVAIMAARETVYPPSPHVERQIYNGFWPRSDERLLEQFHGAEWPDRVRIAEELADERLAWLARRLIWIERPDLCPPDHAAGFAQEKARRLLAAEDECDGWNTLQKAGDDLATVLNGLPPEAAAPFHAFDDYIASKRAECGRTMLVLG
jgi:exodeoxyribonuclease-1